MAGKSYAMRVQELAALRGVVVYIEDFGGDDGFGVELYGGYAHLAFDKLGMGHTSINTMGGTGATTRAAIWKLALRDLQEFEVCDPDCVCYTGGY